MGVGEVQISVRGLEKKSKITKRVERLFGTEE